MTELLSKNDAIAASKKTYTLCKPCGKCGTQERYVKKSNCVYCAREKSRKLWSDPDFSKRETERRREKRNSDPEYNAKKNERNKKWAKANPEKMEAAIKDWSLRNKNRIREKANAWRREQYRNNPEYRMRCAMSAMVKRILGKSGDLKECAAEKILGYSKAEFVKHIEAQFTNKMTWDNYGIYWHIDHIVPVAHFFRIGEKDPAVINALTNLRPLEAEKNKKKSDKLESLL